jgi:hypothetical protein
MVFFFTQPGGRHPQTEETGVPRQAIGNGVEVLEVLMQNLSEFGVRLAARAPAHHEHSGHPRVLQALRQHTSPYHAGRTKDDDVHAPSART